MNLMPTGGDGYTSGLFNSLGKRLIYRKNIVEK